MFNLVFDINLEVMGDLGLLGSGVGTSREGSNSSSSSSQIFLDNSLSISDNLSLEGILNGSFLGSRERTSRERLTGSSTSLSQVQGRLYITFNLDLKFPLDSASKVVLFFLGVRTSREGFVGKTSLGQILLYVMFNLILDINLEIMGDLGFLGSGVRTSREGTNSSSSSSQIFLDNSLSISDNLSLEGILNGSFLGSRERASRERLTGSSTSLSQVQGRLYITFNLNLKFLLDSTSKV